MGTELVLKIMRWDVTVLRESPWYLEILQEGEQRGEQRGRTEEARSLILRQLTRRIGQVSPTMRSQVESLSLERLESLGEALLDFSSAADLEQWLRSR
jgi:predicted transposase YdaD